MEQKDIIKRKQTCQTMMWTQKEMIEEKWEKDNDVSIQVGKYKRIKYHYNTHSAYNVVFH